MKPRKGYIRLLSVGSVPVFVHWSFPAGGILVAVIGRVDPPQWVYYCIAYTLLIALHESGHVLAAVSMRLKLFAVEISGVGGLCRVERPRSLWQSVILYTAGLLAQVCLFVSVLGYLQRFRTPQNVFGRAIVFTFTLVNCVIFLINLIPQRSTRTGFATDGSVLWRLFLHVYLGHPHPHPPLVFAPPEQAPVFPADTRLIDKPGFRPPGFIHGIEMLNDRTTPMDFVVSCLVKHVGLTEQQAIVKMVDIHNTGGMIFKLATAQEARKVAAVISDAARVAGHSFTCRYASI